MRSKISFFSVPIMKKNSARFWPIWASYLLLWILILILPLMLALSRNSAYDATASTIVSASYAGIVLSFFFGVISAMALWSCLYNARSASFTASLPIRREGLFLTNYVTGLVWLIASNLVISLLLTAVSAAYGVLDIAQVATFFGTVTLAGLFFYSFATLLAMLTGNLLMLPALYVILNFAWFFIATLAHEVLSILTYGYTSTGPRIMELSPIIKMFSSRTFIAGEYMRWDMTWFFIYAVIGIALSALALLLFRRRHMESAGEVVSEKRLRPVFKYFTTFAGALVLGVALYFMLGYGANEGSLPMLIFSVVIGCFASYYTAEMLLHKSFRVIKSAFAGFLISAAIMAATLVAIDFDVFGVERRLPEAEAVESVSFNISGRSVQLREPENIRAVIAEHSDFIERRELYDNTNYGWSFFHVTYTLKNGGSLSRSYRLPQIDSSREKILSIENILNSQEALRTAFVPPFEVTSETISYFTVNFYDSAYQAVIGKEFGYAQAVEFYHEYLMADYESGNIRVRISDYSAAYATSIYLNFFDSKSETSFTISFYATPDTENVSAWLSEKGIELLGYPEEDTEQSVRYYEK